MDKVLYSIFSNDLMRPPYHCKDRKNEQFIIQLKINVRHTIQLRTFTFDELTAAGVSNFA